MPIAYGVVRSMECSAGAAAPMGILETHCNIGLAFGASLGPSAQSKRLSDSCCQDIKARRTRNTELVSKAIFRYRLRAICSLVSSSPLRREVGSQISVCSYKACHPHTYSMIAKVNLTGHQAQEAQGSHIFPNSALQNASRSS